METSTFPPLQSLTLKARPFAPHALSWSPDAELAVATGQGIFIYLPSYPRGPTPDAQFSLSIQTTAVFKPNPAINAPLCAFAGAGVPSLASEPKSNAAAPPHVSISGSASAIGQPTHVAWSPGGLGHNRRPVLAVMTTHGELLVMGDTEQVQGAGVGFGARARGFKNWKMLWALGPQMPLPVGGKLQVTDERVTSFAWAKEVGNGTALLAYTNDVQELVVMSVQYLVENGEAGWRVEEVHRMSAVGPHLSSDQLDPDFVPFRSAFYVNWSPWAHLSNERQTATISYIGKNHVAFRRVTITAPWERGQPAPLVVEGGDTLGICVSLQSDAFVEWEDAVWLENKEFVARGVIGTPLVAKPFQVTLTGSLDDQAQPHTTQECKTTYTPDEDYTTNPITGLVIQKPDSLNKPPSPHYTLVRQSATSTNEDWFQTTVPETDEPAPQWAEDVAQRATRQVTRSIALRDLESDSDSDDDGDGSDEENMGVDEREPQVRPRTYRFWGIASSPGDGTTVALVSGHKTMHGDRRGLCKLLFSSYVAEEGAQEAPRRVMPTSVSIEGRAWEWMYGHGEDVVGAGFTADTAPVVRPSALKEQFKGVFEKMLCTFCDEPLRTKNGDGVCTTGHAFILCVTSGLAIMTPGVSRVCGVCDSRCLQNSELEKIAQEYLGTSTLAETSTEFCGGCGGKFVV